MSDNRVTTQTAPCPAEASAKRDSLKRRPRITEKQEPDLLDPAEVDAILAGPNTGCPTGLRNRCMLELMARCGLRVVSVIGLRNRDIKWSENLLALKITKGGKPRRVPISDETKALLQRWADRRQTLRGSTEVFFTSLGSEKRPQRRAIHSSYLRELVKRLARKARIQDLERAHPHALRHSAAIAMLDSGLNIRDVQSILGHVNVKTTEIYTNIRPRELVEKYRRLMGHMGSRTPDLPPPRSARDG